MPVISALSYPSSRFIGELCGEVHAGRQPEGIRVKHWVVWVEEVVHPVENRTSYSGIGRCESGGSAEWRVLGGRHRRLHALQLQLRRPEGLRVGTRASGVVTGFFVDHIGLLVVFLLCTHGINLGRQSSIPKGKKKRVSLPS